MKATILNLSHLVKVLEMHRRCLRVRLSAFMRHLGWGTSYVNTCVDAKSCGEDGDLWDECRYKANATREPFAQNFFAKSSSSLVPSVSNRTCSTVQTTFRSILKL
mmetsp:Transcript_2154/g.6420  ORF Transcript_2154/g.6420 Transcript_2154/m.6420 type:complete len:105 (+) Transcript_2154:274-588(+)